MKFNLSLLAEIRMYSLSKEDRAKKMSVEHDELMQAIKMRDTENAKAKIIKHLEAVKLSI
jgi:DNA-binding FadR family transcriptional regulator